MPHPAQNVHVEDRDCALIGKSVVLMFLLNAIDRGAHDARRGLACFEIHVAAPALSRSSLSKFSWLSIVALIPTSKGTIR
jgi:hypothetical protein